MGLFCISGNGKLTEAVAWPNNRRHLQPEGLRCQSQTATQTTSITTSNNVRDGTNQQAAAKKWAVKFGMDIIPSRDSTRSYEEAELETRGDTTEVSEHSAPMKLTAKPWTYNRLMKSSAAKKLAAKPCQKTATLENTVAMSANSTTNRLTAKPWGLPAGALANLAMKRWIAKQRGYHHRISRLGHEEIDRDTMGILPRYQQTRPWGYHWGSNLSREEVDCETVRILLSCQHCRHFAGHGRKGAPRAGWMSCSLDIFATKQRCPSCRPWGPLQRPLCFFPGFCKFDNFLSACWLVDF